MPEPLKYRFLVHPDIPISVYKEFVSEYEINELGIVRRAFDSHVNQLEPTHKKGFYANTLQPFGDSVITNGYRLEFNLFRAQFNLTVSIIHLVHLSFYREIQLLLGKTPHHARYLLDLEAEDSDENMKMWANRIPENPSKINSEALLATLEDRRLEWIMDNRELVCQSMGFKDICLFF